MILIAGSGEIEKYAGLFVAMALFFIILGDKEVTNER
jgi:hypothetical protein